jgi:chromosome partitioning protein
MLTIAVSTNKGGVLKTSLTTNLAGVLSESKRILIIDTDNQGNVLVSFGKNPDSVEISLYDVLLGDNKAEDAIINVHKNIDVLPSNDDMSFLEFDVLKDTNKYKQPFNLLSSAVSHLKEQYDVILIDTPPNLGLVQGNALSFADEVLIPFQPEGYSMRSLVKILKSISDFKTNINHDLRIKGIVGTLVDSRTTLHSEVLQQCRRFCLENDIKIFDTVIPRSIRFASSVAYDRLPATLTERKNPLVQAYFELAEEVFPNG